MVHRLRHALRTALLAGILVVLPAVITYLVLAFLYGMMAELVYPALDIANRLLERRGVALPRLLYPLLGVNLLLLVLFVVGTLTRNYVGRRIVSAGESLLHRIPIAGTIYAAAKQTLHAFAAADRAAFRRIVLIEYPRRGLYSVAFVTADFTGQAEGAEGHLVSCFVPTTPNPTSGLLIIVPEADCQPLDMTVDEAMRFVISAGIIAPPRWGAIRGAALGLAPDGTPPLQLKEEPRRG